VMYTKGTMPGKELSQQPCFQGTRAGLTQAVVKGRTPKRVGGRKERERYTHEEGRKRARV